MNYFVKKLKKPSAAIDAMIRGLKKARRRKTFVINMGTYGYFDKGICYGCAATCAVAEAAGITFRGAEVDMTEHHKVVGCSSNDLDEFEFAIDNFRYGIPFQLFDLFKRGVPDIRNKMLPLYSDFETEDLKPYQEYSNELKKIGL